MYIHIFVHMHTYIFNSYFQWSILCIQEIGGFCLFSGGRQICGNFFRQMVEGVGQGQAFKSFVKIAFINIFGIFFGGGDKLFFFFLALLSDSSNYPTQPTRYLSVLLKICVSVLTKYLYPPFPHLEVYLMMSAFLPFSYRIIEFQRCKEMHSG